MTEATLSFTAGDIMRAALRNTRAINVDQPIQAKDTFNARFAMNAVLKHMQTQELHLWAKIQAVLPLVTDQKQYFLGPGGANVAKANTFVDTQLSRNHSKGFTTINVDSVEGIEGADGIFLVDPVLSTQGWDAINDGVLSISSGLKVDNGASGASGADFDFDTTVGTRYVMTFGYTLGTSASAIFSITDTAGTLTTTTKTATGGGRLSFTARDTTSTFNITNGDAGAGDDSTVSSLQLYDKDSGDFVGVRLDDDTRFWSRALFVTTSIEIADSLPSAGASGNTVFSYSENIERPESILDAQFAETLTASEIPTNQWSREEYFDQSDKDSSGTVVQWYYSPQLSLGELYLWQVASNSDQLLRFTYSRPMFISVNEVDTVDIPDEWALALIWRVSAELGPQYGVSLERQAILDSKATIAMDEALDHDTERESMSLQPDLD